MNSGKLKQIIGNGSNDQIVSNIPNNSFNTKMNQYNGSAALQNDSSHSNNEIQLSMNGSSNTIRNLLAQQSPHSLPPHENMPQTAQLETNIRPSGGMVNLTCFFYGKMS